MKFDLSNNMLLAAGAKVLAEALHGNQVMTELNLSDNSMGLNKPDWIGGSADMSGVIDIATKAIPTMPALTNLDISNNHITKDLQDMLEGICKSKSTELKL